MDNIEAEITRVKASIEKTKSPHLKRDYEKYLRKLEKKSRRGVINRGAGDTVSQAE